MLPLNILNEKMFVVFWFWLYIVFIFSSIAIVYRIIVIVFPFSRYYLLAKIHRKAEAKDIKILIDSGSYGDWFVIYLVSLKLNILLISFILISFFFILLPISIFSIAKQKYRSNALSWCAEGSGQISRK